MNSVAHMPVPARQRGKIAPVKLAHVVLRTSNATRLVSFYKTLLEAEEFFSDGRISFLTYDEEHHRIAIAEVPGLKNQSRRLEGVDHFAFTYESLSDLLATYERLKVEGIMPIWSIHHGPTLSFYYRDPDRNFVELQVDAFDTEEGLTAYLNSRAFDTNPIGVDFDPEDLIARHRRGEPESALLACAVDSPRNMRTIPREFVGTFHWMLIRIASFFRMKV